MLTEEVTITIKDVAKKLTGYRKRDFMAKVAEDYFAGSARKAESIMGWKRTVIQLGLEERENVHQANRESDQNIKSLRISIDSLVTLIFQKLN